MNVKYSTIACIILASGVGRRFGVNKLLTAIDRSAHAAAHP